MKKFIRDNKAICFMVLIILVVDIFVRLVTYLSDRRTADAINEKLKSRREERTKK